MTAIDIYFYAQLLLCYSFICKSLCYVYRLEGAAVIYLSVTEIPEVYRMNRKHHRMQTSDVE